MTDAGPYWGELVNTPLISQDIQNQPDFTRKDVKSVHKKVNAKIVTQAEQCCPEVTRVSELEGFRQIVLMIARIPCD